MAERGLLSAEISLAMSVFGMTLPYGHIRMADDLGLANRAWVSPPATSYRLGGNYVIHMGAAGYISAALNFAMPTGTGARSVFIHELVHVWQGHLGSFPPGGYVFSSLYWQCVGAFSGSNPYDYVLDGRAWAAYNAEQQGNIVRDWFIGGMSDTDAAYRYIVNAIRRADPFYVPSTGTRSIGRYPGALY